MFIFYGNYSTIQLLSETILRDNIMDFFKKGEYSREEYDSTAQEIRDKKIEAGEAERAYLLEKGGDEKYKAYLAALYSIEESQKRLKKLSDQGREEASGLDKEYDRLLGLAHQAMEDLTNFEREKLGMHKEE